MTSCGQLSHARLAATVEWSGVEWSGVEWSEAANACVVAVAVVVFVAVCMHLNFYPTTPPGRRCDVDTQRRTIAAVSVENPRV